MKKENKKEPFIMKIAGFIGGLLGSIVGILIPLIVVGALEWNVFK